MYNQPLKIDIYSDVSLNENGELISLVYTGDSDSIQTTDSISITELVQREIDSYTVPNGPVVDHDGSLSTVIDSLYKDLFRAIRKIEDARKSLKTNGTKNTNGIKKLKKAVKATKVK